MKLDISGFSAFFVPHSLCLENNSGNDSDEFFGLPDDGDQPIVRDKARFLEKPKPVEAFFGFLLRYAIFVNEVCPTFR